MKKYILFIFILILHIPNVQALENETNITDDILNINSNNIYYKDNTYSIIKGNINNTTYVSDIINNIDKISLLEYGIININITTDNNEPLADDHIITNNMKLNFLLENNTTVEYEIIYVGDINNDGIINNLDIEEELSNYINNKEITMINDINNDKQLNLIDITSLYQIVNNSNWDIIKYPNDTLKNKLVPDKEIIKNKEFKVKYYIEGTELDNLVGIEGILNYDKTLLELKNIEINKDYGSIDNNGRFVYLFNNYDGKSALITFTFKALNKGNTTININNIKASIGTNYAILDNEINTNINITEEQTNEDKSNYISIKKETNNNKQPQKLLNNLQKEQNKQQALLIPYIFYKNYKESVININISHDNYIDMLKIKDHNIDFSKEKLEYDIEVDNNVKSLDLDIVLSSNYASYKVIGNENFKVGKNTVTIEVTAEDEKIRNYIINVNKKSDKKEKTKKTNNKSKMVIIALIVFIIIGIIYIIFKEDEEESNLKS